MPRAPEVKVENVGGNASPRSSLTDLPLSPPPRRRRDLPVIPLSAAPVRPGVSPSVQAVRLEREPLGPPGGPRIGLITLGCDKNTVDSEHMMAALVGQGARVSTSVEGCEVIIVNTCGFIQAAKEESIEAILEACALKAEGKVKAVAAVGCLVQRYRRELEEEIPEVDLFLGLEDLKELVPRLRQRGLLPPDEPGIPIMERPLRVLASETPHTSFLKISEGCDHTCAFCAIPLMRGLHRSAPLEALVAEAQALEAQGVKELNLVSQDTTWYGRDLRRRDPSAPGLGELLRALVQETSIPWFRLFYMYPAGITPQMVEILATEPRVLPYLDMPIQHGSDRILQAMRRPERAATIRERVAWLRKAVPDITLRTTVIVGFPGEDEEDFRRLLDLLEELRFDRVGAFVYSPEEGTPAASLPDPVSPEEKQERWETLMAVQREISRERNREQVGRFETVLVDRSLEGDTLGYTWEGRTRGQALEVDGVTLLEGAEGVRPGDFVEVEIVEALDYDLLGRVRR